MDAPSLLRELRARHLIGRGHEHEPLVDYALVAATFTTVTTGAIAGALRRGALPIHVPLGDALLLGLATTRLARLFTREKVTRPIRAPFTQVDDDASPDEVKEHARGHGMVRALGELLTCPRCFGMWAAGGLTIGYLLAPGPTRVVSTILSASLASDWINVRFARARARTRSGGEPAADAARSAWGAAT
jgi:hypothetical protein